MSATQTASQWWNSKSEDDQIWLMMKHGYDTPFDPKRIKGVDLMGGLSAKMWLK